jgi:glycosyltransferase involved in cell wall biosynthesis
MIDITEADIMNSWGRSHQKPLVSIACNAYNHQEYISDAIDSFLMQETDFPFEILVHDDASTDNTADVVQSYTSKYPNLIKPVYQTENQYSLGCDLISFNFSRAKGEYIALCEGDDYWSDKNKLQIQIKKMREHPDCQLSFHPATILINNTITKDVTANHLDDDAVFDVKEVIKGDGGFCPTASIIIKKEAIENLPDFFKGAPVGDYFLQILGSVNAGALYINRIMSVYRIHPGGVWTSTARNYNALKSFIAKMSTSFDEMDKYYSFRYHDEIALIRSNLIMRSLKKDSFDYSQRLELYDAYKSHLSKEQIINFQEHLISDLAKVIQEQKETISEKEELCKKLRLEANSAIKSMDTVHDYAQRVAVLRFIRHPIKKYKAYKELLIRTMKGK